MRDVGGKDIPVGSKVKLVSPCSSYSIGRNNPATGTEWECVGKYTGDGTVHWENGTRNSYKNGELAHAESYIDIWSQQW